MTDRDARHIARNYALGMGEVLPGFKLGIGDEEEFTDKYYFDFIWLTLNDQIPNEPPVAGGACGLTVDKNDSQVELLTHGGYCVLKDSENKLVEMFQLLIDFKNGKKHLADVKSKFDLSSEQLLELSKLIKNTELIKENMYEIINRLLDKVKNYSQQQQNERDR